MFEVVEAGVGLVVLLQLVDEFGQEGECVHG